MFPHLIMWRSTFDHLRAPHPPAPASYHHATCTGFRLPTTPVTSRAVLYGPEVALYLTAVHDIDPDTALFIITEMATGLRWGEIAGLHVTHLDPAGPNSTTSRPTPSCSTKTPAAADGNSSPTPKARNSASSPSAQTSQPS
ncbi:hypothetical protein ACWDRB_67810 [Nonomuraea sp. NPDC003707]